MQITAGQQSNNKTSKSQSVWLYALVFLFCIFLDQFIKSMVPAPFENYFFAFSIQLPVWLMYVIYLSAMAIIFRHLNKKFFLLGGLEKFAWVLISAGAAVNIMERAVLGYVRDFIYISFSRWTGVYNLADGYIIAGVIILLFCHKKFSN